MKINIYNFYVKIPEDVVEDYRKYQDKKKVAKIYGITTKEVTQIIKEKCYDCQKKKWNLSYLIGRLILKTKKK